MYATSIAIHLAPGSSLRLVSDSADAGPAAREPTVTAGVDVQAAPAQILDPAKLPRIALDAQGNRVESGSAGHVMTHFTTAGLIFDARAPRKVGSLKDAREIATECDLLSRKGDWVVGDDYETQLIVDRNFHAPAVDKRSFPHMPTEGWIYTNRKTAWSSDLVWFVLLNDGNVDWYNGASYGFVVPVLRVPASQ